MLDGHRLQQEVNRGGLSWIIDDWSFDRRFGGVSALFKLRCYKCNGMHSFRCELPPMNAAYHELSFRISHIKCELCEQDDSAKNGYLSRNLKNPNTNTPKPPEPTKQPQPTTETKEQPMSETKPTSIINSDFDKVKIRTFVAVLSRRIRKALVSQYSDKISPEWLTTINGPLGDAFASGLIAAALPFLARIPRLSFLPALPIDKVSNEARLSAETIVSTEVIDSTIDFIIPILQDAMKASGFSVGDVATVIQSKDIESK